MWRFRFIWWRKRITAVDFCQSRLPHDPDRLRAAIHRYGFFQRQHNERSDCIGNLVFFHHIGCDHQLFWNGYCRSSRKHNDQGRVRSGQWIYDAHRQCERASASGHG